MSRPHEENDGYKRGFNFRTVKDSEESVLMQLEQASCEEKETAFWKTKRSPSHQEHLL